jgi:hypothetical protein
MVGIEEFFNDGKNIFGVDRNGTFFLCHNFWYLNYFSSDYDKNQTGADCKDNLAAVVYFNFPLQRKTKLHAHFSTLRHAKNHASFSAAVC